MIQKCLSLDYVFLYISPPPWLAVPSRVRLAIDCPHGRQKSVFVMAQFQHLQSIRVEQDTDDIKPNGFLYAMVFHIRIRCCYDMPFLRLVHIISRSLIAKQRSARLHLGKYNRLLVFGNDIHLQVPQPPIPLPYLQPLLSQQIGSNLLTILTNIIMQSHGLFDNLTIYHFTILPFTI